jgi:hypothetical protein
VNTQNVDDKTNALEKNQIKSQIITDRSKKMRKIFDELVSCKWTDSQKIFVEQVLKHERALLLVWILTEKLNHESQNNAMWRRFLLNQEIFDKNLQEGTTRFSENLDSTEMS